MKTTTLFFIVFLLSSLPALAGVEEENLVAIHGRVTDPFGTPLPEVGVKLFLSNLSYLPMGKMPDSVTLTLEREVKTKKDGTYSVKGLPYGYYRVEFSLTGFWGIAWQMIDSSESELLDIGLHVVNLGNFTETEPSYIRGRVTDTHGKPVRDATVTLRDVYDSGFAVQVRSDRWGLFSYRIQGFSSPFEYAICARAEGYYSDCGAGRYSDLLTHGIELKLEPTE